MDQQVCHVIGQDGSDLYGIACNNKAYMRKRSPQGAWYGIAKEEWENAKRGNSNISESLVTIEENDPRASIIQKRGTAIEWGGG